MFFFSFMFCNTPNFIRSLFEFTGKIDFSILNLISPFFFLYVFIASCVLSMIFIFHLNLVHLVEQLMAKLGKCQIIWMFFFSLGGWGGGRDYVNVCKH